MRSLVDIIKKEHFIDESEFMETQIVAVPEYAHHVNSFQVVLTMVFGRNLTKEWNSKYERLTNFIVPRSST